jgi:L-gulonolactone oxidase
MSNFAEHAPFASWGRVVRRSYPIARPRFAADLGGVFGATDRPATALPVGMGRSYGDSCLNGEGGLISMRGLDRLIDIDTTEESFSAQAGMTLSESLQHLVLRGLFLPVVPGTRMATLGGAVANDVHGKNHLMAGSFGCQVRRFELVRSDGSRRVLGPGDPSGLFEATIAGLGLTGAITWVELGVRDEDSSYLDAEDLPFDTLDQYFELMAESAHFEHRVAWIDCTRPGRGVFSRGRFLDDGQLMPHPDKIRLRAPGFTPGFLLNGLTLRAFNALYAAAKTMKKGPQRVHYAPFFFPLDSIGDWNRVYGGAGFYQYQSVVPLATARDATKAMLKAIASSGEGSMLAVLKEFGPARSPGLLSFPMEGTTLALDFRNRGSKTLKLFERLDAIVTEAGGRLYAAKDGRIPAEAFRRMYPRWTEVERLRDPAITSDFWSRILRG